MATLESAQLIAQIKLPLSGDTRSQGAAREFFAVAGCTPVGGDHTLTALVQRIILRRDFSHTRFLFGKIGGQTFDLLVRQIGRQWLHLCAVATSFGKRVQLVFDVRCGLPCKRCVLSVARLTVSAMAKRAGVL